MAEEPQYETRAERRAADAANRRGGAHRAGAAAGSHKAATAVVIVLALVAVLLIIGAVNIIRSAGSDPEAKVEEQQQVEPGADESSKSAEPSESKSADASDAPSDDASESTPSDDESTGGSDVKTVKGDSSDPKLSILNASGVNGAARKYANQYESQGWTLGRVGNAGTKVSSTTVYYSSSEYRDAAERVAKGLGGVSVEQSSRYQVGVTILMGPEVANSDPSKG